MPHKGIPDMLKRPVTLWYRWNDKEKAYKYNHLEEGWNSDIKPIPKFESQNIWNQFRWAKEFANLDKNNVVIYAN